MSWKSQLKEKVKKYLRGYSACHDYFHHKRTLGYALEIAKKVKCDENVVYAGALLHDIGYKDNERDDKRHHIYGMEIAQKWLKEVGFPNEKIQPTLEVIRLHDNCTWGHDYESTDHIETKIIQDADRIDALGAVGIARLAYYYGEKGYPIYNPAKVKETKEVWFNHSLVDQIARDPIKKYNYLNFPISKKTAKERNKFLKQFYKHLKDELQTK